MWPVLGKLRKSVIRYAAVNNRSIWLKLPHEINKWASDHPPSTRAIG
jgi:hypothetical protein